MDKFNNKYRIASARLQTWDYGSNGAYFITICTKNRDHFFGEIVVSTNDGVAKMELNSIGQLAEKYWLEIPDHYPFIELGNFVVMPNHTHGILIIDKTDGDGNDVPNVPIVETPKLGVSTSTAEPSAAAPSIGGKNEKWQPNTIGSIINQYKRMVTINARIINPAFGWQSRFHDHIIRDAKSFNNIQNYISNNPQNWKGDKFYRE
jgi:putative transposase